MAYTEWYRIFQDDPWSLDDQENDVQHEDSYQMPDHLLIEDVQDQSVCTNLMVISNVHEEGAELSDEEFDDGDNDSGDSGNGDSGNVHGCVDSGIDIGSIAENTENFINSPDATHLDVEDQDETDTHDCIHQQVPILQTKLATSVSKVLGVTPLVKTLDKARLVLHKEENSRNRFHQDKYKDTLASIQTQLLAAHQKCSKEMQKWERECVVKNCLAPSFEHFKTKTTIMSQYKKKKLSKE